MSEIEDPEAPGRCAKLAGVCFGSDRGNDMDNQWRIIPDPNSPFIDPYKPYFIDQKRTVAQLLFGKTFSAMIFGASRSPLTSLLLFVGLISDLFGAYAITEFFDPYFSFFLLIGLLLRCYFFLLLQRDLLARLACDVEYEILFVSTIIATVGLLDAFNYDIRCLWAVGFMMTSLYSISQDASRKLSKRNATVSLFIYGLALVYFNFFVVVMLIYFGYVPNLRNRIITIALPSSSGSNNDSSSSSFNVNSLGITLAFMQAILIYLLKIPYHLLKNDFAILKLRLLTERIIPESEEMAASIAEDTNEMETLNNKEEEVEVGELENNESDLSIRSTRYAWRITPLQSEFLDRKRPFHWDQHRSVATVLFGREVGRLHYNYYHNSVLARAVLFVFAIIYVPTIFLVFTGVISKTYSLLSLIAFVFIATVLLDINYDLLKRVLRTLEGRVIFLFLVLGMVGFLDMYSYDIRCTLSISLGFGILIVGSYHEITTRVLDPFLFDIFLCLLYLIFASIIGVYYVGLASNIRDRRIDLASLIGRQSPVSVGTVELSLYCWEFVLLFALKNWYYGIYKHGFAILKVRLKYTRVDRLSSYGSEHLFTDTGRISGVFDMRKVSTLLRSSGKSVSTSSKDVDTENVN